MRTKSLNVKNRDIVKFIKISLKRRKIPPTVREVAFYFNISKSSAHRYLKNLYQIKTIKTRKTQHKNRVVARGLILKNKR